MHPQLRNFCDLGQKADTSDETRHAEEFKVFVTILIASQFDFAYHKDK